MLRFSGFELDQERAELRRPDGETIKLRPKTLEMLRLFAANSGRVLSKQQLMEAVWPNVHVGEDSLFQCIREIRTALGDDKRQVVRVISGRGYLFQAQVTSTNGTQTVIAAAPDVVVPPVSQPAPAEPDTKAAPRRLVNPRNACSTSAGVAARPSLPSRGSPSCARRSPCGCCAPA